MALVGLQPGLTVFAMLLPLSGFSRRHELEVRIAIIASGSLLLMALVCWSAREDIRTWYRTRRRPALFR